MKKSIAALLMIFCVLAVQANGNGEAVSPKSTNYKQVISKIEYPQVCKEKGIEGLVLVTVSVDSQGNVTDYNFESYPCTDLRDAVKNVIQDLAFVPARNENGEIVAGKVAVPVNFKLTI